MIQLTGSNKGMALGYQAACVLQAFPNCAASENTEKPGGDQCQDRSLFKWLSFIA